MNEALLVLGMALVTFGVRYPVLAIVGRVDLPPAVARALRYVPPAVLTAIVFPAALMPEGDLALGPDNPYLIGALAAGLVAWRARSLLATIGIGMAVFLIWRALISG
jgi:branched-subunit amino acid transport protein